MTGPDALPVAFALACMWVGGYATGRGRLVRELLAWADWKVAYAPRRSPAFWVAVPVVVVACCCLWAFRPLRTLHHWRAARERDRRRPLPRPARPGHTHPTEET
ncbi:hypothetical protein [[Kitasatospora] papulosa]|uniref:hypothetical protein n=1 Tax=[Kitasatospora] papulosa TaxID=1464011 RepID=UPI003688DB94